jgi:hypothetical protein
VGPDQGRDRGQQGNGATSCCGPAQNRIVEVLGLVRPRNGKGKWICPALPHQRR